MLRRLFGHWSGIFIQLGSSRFFHDLPWIFPPTGLLWQVVGDACRCRLPDSDASRVPWPTSPHLHDADTPFRYALPDPYVALRADLVGSVPISFAVGP